MDQPYNFQTSGPIIDADRSLYIEREEDRHLLNLLRGEEMAYVNLLGPPQIGKTSLFYHLCCGLPEGYVPVMVNLCAASDAAEPQWYAYLCRRMLAQLDIDLDEDQQASLAQTSNKLGFLDF